MKKFLVVALLAAMLFTFAACADKQDTGSDKGGVIGSVNGVDVYQDEFDYYFANYFQSYYNNYYDYFKYYMGVDLLDEESAKSTLADLENYSWEMVVRSELIKQVAAKDYDITYEDNYLKDVLSWGAYDSIIVGNVYQQMANAVKEEMLAAMTVSDADIQAKYEEDPTAWDSRKTSHILISFDTSDEAAKTEAYAKAQDLIKQLNDGADFAELAKANSDDGSAQDGGVIDTYFNISGTDVTGSTSLFPEYVAAAFQLAKVGDYSQEPVLSSAGYHIIKLDDIRDTFEASKDAIAQSLKTVSDDDLNAKMSAILDAAKAAATIEQTITFKYYAPADAASPTDVSGTDVQSNDNSASTDSGSTSTDSTSAE